MKLSQGKNKTLAQGAAALPDMESGIGHLLQPTRMAVIKKQNVNGYTQELPVYFNTLAARQPMAENLAIRKEGERSWRWHVIHVQANVTLRTDDVVIINDIKFRIMQRTDWSEYGYNEYHAIEGFQ